ncbi:hypothetical protein KP509_21G005200 [Ceratopteris richardii]|uniref:Uncharacterized protein n=1 Tax=Ceratopteris richardii TaxID=49495 RepID=A0A8T2S9W4_CERRI|nr:hypothetical protein KP509_21G005200 [Ceratopteris richardii]
MAMQKIRTAMKQALKWVRLPWQITGPVSHPEFKDSLPNAREYRLTAPATPPKRVFIPHAEPERVLNISYFTRDGRRAPHKVTRIVADAEYLKAKEEESATSVPRNPSPSAYRLGWQTHLDDCPGDGYQR